MIRLIVPLLLILSAILLFPLFMKWIPLRLAKVPVSFLTLLRWRILNLPVEACIEACLYSYKAQIPIEPNTALNHAKAKGDVARTAKLYVLAKKKGANVSFEDFCDWDKRHKNLETWVEALLKGRKSKFECTFHSVDEKRIWLGEWTLKLHKQTLSNENSMDTPEEFFLESFRGHLKAIFLRQPVLQNESNLHKLSNEILRQFANSSLPFEIIDFQVIRIHTEATVESST